MMILDDYNRLFNKIPFDCNFQAMMDEFRSFDKAADKKMQEVISRLLAPLGSYKAISYSTGSDAIRYTIYWLLHFSLVKEICYFRGVYHSEYLRGQEQRLFAPNLPVSILDWNEDDPESIIKAVQEKEQALIIIEPSFSDYFVPLNTEFYRLFVEKLRAKSNLLLVDEIRLGLYRSGTFSWSESHGIKPDVICFAKGLGLGVPIALSCYSEDLFKKMKREDIEIARTSQATNGISLKIATSLLTFFEKNEFCKSAQDITDRIKKICSEILGGRKFQCLGFVVKIKLELSISRTMRFFRDLITMNIVVRFPENDTLTLVFPYDSDSSQIIEVIETIVNVWRRYETK